MTDSNPPDSPSPTPDTADKPAVATASPRRAKRFHERPVSTELPTSPFQLLLTLLMAGACVAPAFLGGGSTPWVAGLAIAPLGLLMILRPASHNLGFWATLSLLALVVWTGLTFLPLSWFPSVPWRQTLQEIGIDTSSTLSPQPFVSFENWLVLLSGVIWFSYCQATLWRDGERRAALLVVGLACGVLACLALYGKSAGLRYTLWSVPGISTENYFGPFPNRNHFATLLALGAVILGGFAWESKRKNFVAALVFTALLALVVYAVAMNRSRAGIVLLTFGLSLWFFVIALQMGSVRRILMAGVVLVLLGGVFSMVGGTAFERLQSGFTGEFRTKVWSDGLKLLANHSFFGIGLGNFEPVFALTQEYSGGEHRVTNPESSLLWLGTESGLPGIFFFGIALALTLTQTQTLKQGRKSRLSNRRFRAVALVAALVALAHSIIDTPMHTYGIALPVLLCLGLARTQRERGLPLARAVWFSRIGGVFLVALGSFWLASDLLGSRLPSATGAKESYVKDFTRDRLAGEPLAALEDINRSIRWQPLHWSYYYAKARLLLENNSIPARALAEFQKARHLAPDIPWVPYGEAQIWMTFHPNFAISAMRDVLMRDEMRLEENYGTFLNWAAPYPDLLRNLRSLSRMNNTLRFRALPQATPEEAKQLIEAIMAEDPELSSLSAKQKETLFEIWASKVDRAEALQTLKDNPEWQIEGWRVLAQELVEHEKIEDAASLARIRLPSSGLPHAPPGKTIRELDRDARMNPTDFLSGVVLLKAQMDALLSDEALATLERIQKLPDSTDALWREQGDIYYEMQDYERAWEAYSKWDASPLSKK